MTGAEANGPEADDGGGESVSGTGDDAGADQPEANSGSPPDNDTDTGSQDSSSGSPPDNGSDTGAQDSSGGSPSDSGSDTGAQDSSGQDSSGGSPPDHGGGSQDNGGDNGGGQDGSGGGGSRMTLIEHLTELRSRIIKAVIAVGAGALACWFLYPLILDLLLRPYCRTFPISERVDSGLFGPDGGCNLFVTDPLEPFGVRLTVAGYGGLALAMPVVLWQVWRFVAPALYRREKKYAIPFVLIGFALFVTGAGLAVEPICGWGLRVHVIENTRKHALFECRLKLLSLFYLIQLSSSTYSSPCYRPKPLLPPPQHTHKDVGCKELPNGICPPSPQPPKTNN